QNKPPSVPEGDKPLVPPDSLGTVIPGEELDKIKGLLGPVSRIVNPRNPAIVYQVQDNQLRRSVDGGRTCVSISQAPGGSVRTFLLDPVNPSRLLTVTNSLYESLNGGNAWINLSPRIPPTAVAAAQFQGPFAADPSFPTVADKGAGTYDPDTIYVTD